MSRRISYELAKKLADAGYPQAPTIGGGEFIMGDVESDNTGIITTNSAYAPTLSELIEACGPAFDDLIHRKVGIHYKNEWEAWGSYTCCEEHGEGKKIAEGSTPLEAVANLWLVINKPE